MRMLSNRKDDMSDYTPKNLDFERTVRDFVLNMPVAKLYGFHFGQISPGYVETIQPYRKETTDETPCQRQSIARRRLTDKTVNAIIKVAAIKILIW